LIELHGWLDEFSTRLTGKSHREHVRINLLPPQPTQILLSLSCSDLVSKVPQFEHLNLKLSEQSSLKP